MARYRWTGTHAYRDHAAGRDIEPGEELPDEIAERVAESHPHDVEAVDGGGGGDTDANGGDDETAEPPFDPSEYTVEELRDALTDIPEGVKDDHLAALAQAERDGDNRSSALDAIDAARE